MRTCTRTTCASGRADRRPGFELTPVDRPAADLLPAYLRRAPAGATSTRAVIAGEDSSTTSSGCSPAGSARCWTAAGSRSRDGRVVGAILVAEATDAPPPVGGPWVMELFRAPGRPGAGRALLERALRSATGPDARPDGHRGQPAPSGSTQALGFEHVFTAYSVDL